MLGDDSELTFGTLNWRDGNPFLALNTGGTGAPKPIVSAMARLLTDGEISTYERDGNREMRWLIEISGDDPLALNEAEALLVAEVRKRRNTLRWKPAGLNSPVTVFDTFAGSVEQVFDIDGEPIERALYSVTIPARAYARSETLQAATLPGRSSVTTLDAADALTNWAPSPGTGAALTLDTSVKMQGTGSLKVTGSITINPNGSGAGGNLGAKRTASFAAPAGTHVVAAAFGNYPPETAPMLDCEVSGSPIGISASVVSSVALSGGWIEYTWALNNEDPVTITSLDFRPLLSAPSAVGTYPVIAWLDHIRTFTDAPPVDKAGLRLLETGGSVRTPGTLRLSNATTALGSVLVATWQDKGDGYRPDVARWYVSGGSPATATGSVSGQTFDTSAVFEVPNRTLAPGPYVVYVKPTSGSVAASVTATMQTVVGSTAVGPSQAVVATTGGASSILPVGIVHLPQSATPVESSGVTRVTVTMGTPTGSRIDELWLCRIDDAQVTWLDSLTTQRVWIESPSPALPYGAVWVGDNADMSDARHPGDALKMLGRHVFESPVAAVFVAATGAAPSMDLLHYRTWHSNAAD